MNSGIDHADESSDFEDDKVSWDDVVYHEKRQESTVTLDAKDYLALFIASLQTIFLPIIILIIVFLVFGMVFTLLI